jgi:hypothetical protein
VLASESRWTVLGNHPGDFYGLKDLLAQIVLLHQIPEVRVVFSSRIQLLNS